MTGVTVTSRTVHYTSGFSELATESDFQVSVELPENHEISMVSLQTKDDYESLPVRLTSLNSAEEFPTEEYVNETNGNTHVSVSAGRNQENHPGDKMIQTQVTIQAVTGEGELLGEDVVTLNG